MKHVLTSIVCCLLHSAVWSQTIDFAAVISTEYSGETLAQVLDDVTERYAVKFSYSRQVIPVEERVYLKADYVTFAEFLEMLFDDTPVIYGFIGDQIVLSIDPSWSPLSAYDEFDDSIADVGPGPGAIRDEILSPTKLHFQPPAFRVPDQPRDWMAHSHGFILRERQARWREIERDSHAFRVQASIVPHVQAITQAGMGRPLNASFNLLLGVNEDLRGVELGIGANYMRGDVEGLQIAGAFNGAGRNFSGLQASGVLNLSRAHSQGAQIAGAGNIAPHGGELVQIGGAFNVAGRTVSTQIAGGVNVAKEVRHSQIAPINVAGTVKGLQLGVINVSDSSSVSIGLLSFVRKGYKSVELAGQDAMHANFNVRLGVRSFYNILHVSAIEHAESWAYGYGIGTSIKIGRKNYLQLELLSRQINEDERWTDELNLHNQFNVIWDIKLAGRLRAAIGPTFNVAVSQRYNPETDTYGTELPNYTWFDKTYERGSRDPVNVKAWVGIHLGIRLSSD